MCKRIITIILALAAVCGCQKTEKTIYKVPLKTKEQAEDALQRLKALIEPMVSPGPQGIE